MKKFELGKITRAEFLYSPDYDFGLYLDIDLLDNKNQGIMKYVQSRLEIKELFNNKKDSYYETKELIGKTVKIYEDRLVVVRKK